MHVRPRGLCPPCAEAVWWHLPLPCLPCGAGSAACLPTSPSPCLIARSLDTLDSPRPPPRPTSLRRPPHGHTDFEQRQLLMVFTCSKCATRAAKAFSKQAYEQVRRAGGGASNAVWRHAQMGAQRGRGWIAALWRLVRLVARCTDMAGRAYAQLLLPTTAISPSTHCFAATPIGFSCRAW